MRALSLILLVLAASACEEKKPTLPPGASSPLVVASVAPAATVVKFTIDGASKATLTMEAPIETIKATASNGAGHIDVDLANLPASRGEVKLDLLTLSMSTFGDAAKDKLQTEHARTWLEVADGADGKIDEKTKEANRWAVYAIHFVENASATDLTKVAPTKDGADEVRTVTLTTKGELLVHGIKTERVADVELQFRYEPGAPATKPRALGVMTRKPFRVILGDHEVKPRDAAGKIKRDAFHLLGTKVADNADIALDLRAKPQS